MSNFSNKFSAFFQIIRWKNVSITLATLWLVFTFLPAQVHECAPDFTLYFMLFTLAFACVVGAGNIHNDMLDVEGDAANKKERLVIPSLISARGAKHFFIALYALGFVSISIVAVRFEAWDFIVFYLTVMFVIMTYNSHLKCVPFVGNVVVAFLCAAVIVAPLFFKCVDHLPISVNSTDVFGIIFAFSIFSFLINLLREIVKDLQDMKGDLKVGCHTLPVTYGVINTRRIISVTTLLFMIGLLFWTVGVARTQGAFFAVMIFLIITVPLGFCIMKLYDENYSTAQKLLKMVLLIGLFVFIVLNIVI